MSRDRHWINPYAEALDIDIEDIIKIKNSVEVDILTRVSDHELSLFTEEEAVLVDRRRDEMLKLDYDFAFEYALTKIE
jgi:hypothetical protein